MIQKSHFNLKPFEPESKSVLIPFLTSSTLNPSPDPNPDVEEHVIKSKCPISLVHFP